MTIQHLRSSTANKRPTAAAMSDGQLAVNTNATNPGLFFKDADGNIRKTGPVFIGTSAPNSSPASGGSTGHAVGEQWLDSTGGVYVHKIWDGTAWRSESGSFVSVAGDNMTGNLTLGTDKVVLNASTGAATFAGKLIQGTGDATGGANRGVTLDNGYIAVNRPGGTGNILQGFNGSSSTSVIKNDGSATFAGKVVSGSSSLANTAVEFYNNSSSTNTPTIYARNHGNGRIFAGVSASTTTSSIDANGSAYFASNVGIGTLSPLANLQVGGYSSSQGISIAAGTSSYSYLYFADGSSGSQQYRGYIQYNHATDSLEIGAAGSERARIDSSGRLGVGTSSPAHLLDINTTDNTTYTAGNLINNATARIHNSSTTTNSFASLAFRTGSGDNAIGFKYTGTANQADFVIVNDGAANGNEVFRIDSAGRLLLGTTNPGDASADELTVENSGHAGVTIRSGSTYSGSIYFSDATSGAAQYGGQITYNQASQFMKFATAQTERLRINGSGSTKFTPSSSSATLQIQQGTVNSDSIRLQAGGTTSTYLEYRGYLGHAWFVDTSEAARIDSSRNILFGKTSQNLATAGFQHRGDAIGLVQITRDSGEPLQLNRLTNDGKLIEFRQDTTAIGSISVQGSDLGIDVNGGERLRLDSSGRLLTGTGTARANFFNTTNSAKLQVESTTSSTSAISVTSNANSAVEQPVLILAKSRGTSAGSNTLVSIGDAVGTLSFQGNDGTDFVEAARIETAIDGNTTANQMPGRITFNTTPSGASSPTEKMRIRNNGNVGIGVTVPDEKLHVAHAGAASVLIEGASNESSNVFFGDGASNTSGAIRYLHSTDAMRFDVFGSEQMRLDKFARLSIGTTVANSGRIVHAHNSTTNSNAYFHSTNGSTGTANTDGCVMGMGNANHAYFWNYENGQIQFATNGTARMTIDAGGRVGLGTASPVNIGAGYEGLTINASTAGTLYLQGSGTSGGRILANGSDLFIGAVQSSGSTIIQRAHGSYETARFDSNGRLGLGTSSPSYELHVAGAGTVAYFEGSGGSGFIGIEDTDDNTSAFIGVDGGSLKFQTSGNSYSDKLVIDSSGRLLVGKTSTSNEHTLQVQAASGANAISVIGRSADDQSEITFYENDNTTVLAQIQQIADRTVIRHRTGYLRFDSGGVNEKMRLDSSGRLLVNKTATSTNEGQVQISSSAVAPKLVLENSGTNQAHLLCQNSNSGYGTNDGFYVGLAGTTGYLWNYESGLIFGATSSEAARIDSNRRMYIGHTNSNLAAPLSIALYGMANITDNAGAVTSGLLRLTDFGTTDNEFIGLEIRNKNSGDVRIMNVDSATTNVADMAFVTDNAGLQERMRIKGNGHILFGATGTAAPSYFFSPDSGGGTFVKDTNSTNSRTAFIFRINGSQVGSITTSGSSTAYNTSSDHRLKENVVDITDGITRVKQLQPKRFNFIADADTTVDGFLAHEAQTVVPEAVTGTHNEVDDDGNAVMQGIDQSKLVPLLTAALQEAITKIETLEAKVAALEAG